MDRPALFDFDLLAISVEDFAENVEDLTLRHVANGHRDCLAGVVHFLTADESIGWLERDGANEIVTEVLSDLEGELNLCSVERVGRLECVVDAGDGVVRELDVNNGSGDTRDSSYRVRGLRGHDRPSCLVVTLPRQEHRRRRRSRKFVG